MLATWRKSRVGTSVSYPCGTIGTSLQRKAGPGPFLRGVLVRANQFNPGRFPCVSCIPYSLLVHSDFQLPDPAGRAGGACTSTLLNILYKDEQIPQNDMSFVEVLEAMRVELGRKGFEQIPQLTSSQEIDLTHKFDLVPDNFRGNKYAVMIGINYVGHNPGELVRVL